jgi:hypothetical protein
VCASALACHGCRSDALASLAYQYRVAIPRAELPTDIAERQDCWCAGPDQWLYFGGWEGRVCLHPTSNRERSGARPRPPSASLVHQAQRAVLRCPPASARHAPRPLTTPFGCLLLQVRAHPSALAPPPTSLGRPRCSRYGPSRPPFGCLLFLQVRAHLPHTASQHVACGEAQPHLRAQAARSEGATAAAQPGHRAAAARRLHRSGPGHRRLRAGHRRLRAGHRRLRAGHPRLKAARPRLKAGHPRLRAGHRRLR